MNLKLAFQLAKNMGPRYVAYRLKHEWDKRSGKLEKIHPTDPQKITLTYLSDWRKSTPKFLFSNRESITLPSLDDKTLKSLENDAHRILNGEVKFFNSEWKALGEAYDWLTNPETGFRYSNEKHWSKIEDFNPKNGDIKYVWEKSRFSHILTIIRYDYYFNKDHSAFVFKEIASWINANPINQGPNWKCSQEISLRSFNWFYALYFYKDSSNLTEGIFQSILHNIYWSLHHVYNHIDFSRIAVRNNHAITETLFLAVSKFLFPFTEKSKKWGHYGKLWFEEEIAYQIYEDGTFLQFSMNYHRVVVQLLSLGIKLFEIHDQPFSPKIYDRAHKSVNFLFQCLQNENGHLPNYGSNDGALFFPLSQTDYRDYRAQLNTLHQIITGKQLFNNPVISEESAWLNQVITPSKKMPILEQQFGAQGFLNSGYFILREKETFTFIRCGGHKDRPAQADNLHIDIWYKGNNILRDAGSYKYNTTEELKTYFMGTASHNTVMVQDESQMLKGGRFIWYYWSQALRGDWEETEDSYIFKGEINAFGHLNKNATHYRELKKLKHHNIWIIKDCIKGLHNRKKKQIWNINCNKIVLDSTGSKKIRPALFSSHYGQKESAKAIVYEFDNEITTTLKLT